MPTKWRSYCDIDSVTSLHPMLLCIVRRRRVCRTCSYACARPWSRKPRPRLQPPKPGPQPRASSLQQCQCQTMALCRPTIVSTIDDCVVGTRYLLCLETLVSNRPSYISTKTRRIPQGQGMQGRSLRGQDLQRQGLTSLCLSPEYKL